MAREKTELKEVIAREKAHLGDTFDELEARAKALVDWRAQFEAHPTVMLAAAFGGGLVLAGLLGDGRNRAIEDDDEDPGEDEEDDDDDSWAPDVVHQSHNGAHRRKARSGFSRRTLDELKGALIGVAAARAMKLLDGFIPGLGNEMKDQHNRRRPPVRTP
ncbi:MAG: hypothetical protein ACT4OZ_07775 [Gemmatimonadota bacterium]